MNEPKAVSMLHLARKQNTVLKKTEIKKAETDKNSEIVLNLLYIDFLN